MLGISAPPADVIGRVIVNTVGCENLMGPPRILLGWYSVTSPGSETHLVAQRQFAHPCATDAVQGKTWLGPTTALVAEATRRGSNETSTGTVGCTWFEGIWRTCCHQPLGVWLFERMLHLAWILLEDVRLFDRDFFAWARDRQLACA